MRFRASSGALVGLILLVGLVLRLFRLDGQSLWFDEAYSISVSRLPFTEAVDALVADVRQAPLHFAALAGWMKLAGTGVWGARLFSVLASAGGLVFAWLFARRLFGARTALLTVTLLAVAQLDQRYAQEARMYALYASLTTCAAWLGARAVLDRDRLSFFAAAVVGALAVLTHYYALWALVALAAWAVSVRRAHPLPATRWIGGLLLFLALIVPWWLLGAGRQAERVGAVLPQRPESWFAVDATSALRTLNELHGGLVPLLHEPASWAAALGALLLGVPVLLGLRRSATEDEPTGAASPGAASTGGVRLCVLLVVLPLVTALLLGAAFRFQYATRYLLPCLVPYLTLAARGLTSISFAAVRAAWIGAAILWGLAGIAVQTETVHKVQWREALRQLVDERGESEATLFLPGERVPLEWGIYHPELDARSTALDAALSEDGPPGLWLVAFERTPAQAEATLQLRRRLAQGFVEHGETVFFRVRLVHFARR